VNWIAHYELLKYIRIEGIFECIEPLRIGAGRSDVLTSAVDLAVLRIGIRDEKGNRIDIPYIPGSSLKGVFRTYAKYLGRIRNVIMCNGLPNDTCMDSSDNYGMKLYKYIQRLMKTLEYDEIKRIFDEEICIGCKIFGAPSYLGNVFFSDSFPYDPKNKKWLNYSFNVKPGIAIDRRTGAAAKKALFEVEFVEPGSEFYFTIDVKNIPNYALGLLAEILLEIDSGRIRLGGFKTRGFGKVKVKNLKVTFSAGVKRDSENRRFLIRSEEIDQDVEIPGSPEEKETDARKFLNKLIEVWYNVSPKIPKPKWYKS